MNTKELKMAGIGLIIFIVVGFVLVGTGKETMEEKATSQLFQSNAKLRSYAANKCKAKIKEALGQPVYAPTESTPGAPEQVHLKWVGKAKSDYKEITCSYTTGRGVGSLEIDGKTIIPQQ